MIRRLLNAPGKWVTSSLARAARFSSAGRKSTTRHRQWGLVAARQRAAVGTIQQQGAVGMRHVKREMGEGDGSMEGSRRRRDGHEDGNLRDKE